VYMHVHTYVCACICVCVCMYICTLSLMYMYVEICMYRRTCTKFICVYEVLQSMFIITSMNRAKNNGFINAIIRSTRRWIFAAKPRRLSQRKGAWGKEEVIMKCALFLVCLVRLT